MSGDEFLSTVVNSGDAAAIIQVAQEAASVVRTFDPLEMGNAPVGIVVKSDETFEVLDPEQYLDCPRRKKGYVTIHDALSFADLVNRYKTDATVIYADVDAPRITAVFDDHFPENNDAEGCPGWQQHRATLALRVAPEWKHWASKSGVAMSQIAFAEHVEDGIREIVEPDGATMLEVAQTFQAHTKVNFKSANYLANGQRQLTYEEEVSAGAGPQGKVQVPGKIKLGITPFDGAQSYAVEARLRFAMREGKLSITYILDYAHKVLEEAFRDVCAVIAAATSVDPLLGTPPSS